MVGGVLYLTACETTPQADRAEDNSAGMGVPQRFPSEIFPGDRRSLEIRVHLDPRGCYLGSLTGADRTGRYLVVWPTGTELRSSEQGLRLPDGSVVVDRDILAADGVLMLTRRLDGIGTDSYWDSAVGFCAPGASRVLVLDSVDRR